MHLLSITPSACPLPGQAIARAPAVRWRALVSVSNGPRADIARGMRSAANVVSKHRSRLGRRVAVVGGDERGETGGKGGRRKDRNTVRTAARPPTRQSRGFRAVQNRMTLIRIERLSCGAEPYDAYSYREAFVLFRMLFPSQSHSEPFVLCKLLLTLSSKLRCFRAVLNSSQVTNSEGL